MDPTRPPEELDELAQPSSVMMQRSAMTMNFIAERPDDATVFVLSSS
jgi:hypothetical protein